MNDKMMLKHMTQLRTGDSLYNFRTEEWQRIIDIVYYKCSSSYVIDHIYVTGASVTRIAMAKIYQRIGDVYLCQPADNSEFKAADTVRMPGNISGITRRKKFNVIRTIQERYVVTARSKEQAIQDVTTTEKRPDSIGVKSITARLIEAKK